MGKWIDEGKKKVWEGDFSEVWIAKFITPKGEKIKWEYLRIKSKDSKVVSVIPITPEKEFVLVKQFRGTRNKYVIEFPAGKAGDNESLVQAAQRELIEETGYQAGKFNRLCPEGPFAPGSVENTLSYFLAADLKFVGRKKSSDVAEDDMEILKLPIGEANDALKKIFYKKSGVEIDVKVWLMIAYVKFFIEKKFLWDLI
ncbi:MAG: ADP-ribose pyrophosphatase [Parcubacteria group bacterium Athens1014_10]|nr:MAG: ADP-ribose pyrophosphatase [Parcubacteria group bacterium Athens1014_10]TSD04694.1 MAG: ADP-ribose pyrophosphatase [Parcubacteria group bacterium Athens0714_12]